MYIMVEAPGSQNVMLFELSLVRYSKLDMFGLALPMGFPQNDMGEDRERQVAQTAV